MLATSEKNLIWLFVGGELLLLYVYKIIRRDFFYWPTDNLMAPIYALFSRLVVKTVVDFR